MTNEDIRSVVRGLVAQIYELDEDEVRDDLNVNDSYGGDSMNKFELIAALERKYSIRFGADTERLNSITALVKDTEKRVNASPGK